MYALLRSAAATTTSALYRRTSTGTTRCYAATRVAFKKREAYELWFHEDADYAEGEWLNQSCAWHCAAQYETGPDGKTWRIINDDYDPKYDIHFVDRDTWVAQKPSEFCRRVLYEVDSYYRRCEDGKGEYDPFEIEMFSAKWMLDGASTLEEMSKKLRDKANKLDRLAKGGFELDGRVSDGNVLIYPPKLLTIDVDEDDPALIIHGDECRE